MSEVIIHIIPTPSQPVTARYMFVPVPSQELDFHRHVVVFFLNYLKRDVVVYFVNIGGFYFHQFNFFFNKYQFMSMEIQFLAWDWYKHVSGSILKNGIKNPTPY
jgi:hypothetical protein